MTPPLSSVQALPNYRLRVEFTDGSRGDIDLSGLVGSGVFSAWRDPAVWAAVVIDPVTGAPTWPGGIDLDTRQLFADLVGGAAVEGHGRRATG
ncbi:MAG: DUF2442 domain-containing protein [Phycisphaerales bacterium]|nr:DUF2442 domain-containing protein [Phycisphaerales bacterium]MCB9841272.1 DUF2442 domain-containing protein [Phycisphaeraceae bacterium]